MGATLSGMSTAGFVKNTAAGVLWGGNLASGYVAREHLGWDYTSFTTDGAWHDLDVSAIVPAGATGVIFNVQIKDDAAGNGFSLARKGGLSTPTIITQVANIFNEAEIIIACDANRVVQYTATKGQI